MNAALATPVAPRPALVADPAAELQYALRHFTDFDVYIDTLCVSRMALRPAAMPRFAA